MRPNRAMQAERPVANSARYAVVLPHEIARKSRMNFRTGVPHANGGFFFSGDDAP